MERRVEQSDWSKFVEVLRTAVDAGCLDVKKAQEMSDQAYMNFNLPDVGRGHNLREKRT